jgi:hypothetical protein
MGNPLQLSTTSLKKSKQSKGGSVNKSDSANRKMLVEACMIKGMGIYQMVDLGLGSHNTIESDFREIQTNWLSMDVGWFNRARLARIQAEKHFADQRQILNSVIASDEATIKEKLYANSILTEVNTQLRDTSQQMDPEEYLQEVIRKKVDDLAQHTQKELVH